MSRIFTLLLPLFLLAPPAQASIQTSNDSSLASAGFTSPDGRNITTDTTQGAHGLDFLDLNTAGLIGRSYDTVAGTSPSTGLLNLEPAFADFRHASLSEVLTLFSNIGLPTPSPLGSAESKTVAAYQAYDVVAATLGTTASPAFAAAPSGIGFTSLAPGREAYTQFFSGSWGAVGSRAREFTARRLGIDGVSHFLVRDTPQVVSPNASPSAVPEPASIVVWGLLGVVGLWRRPEQFSA